MGERGDKLSSDFSPLDMTCLKYVALETYQAKQDLIG